MTTSTLVRSIHAPFSLAATPTQIHRLVGDFVEKVIVPSGADGPPPAHSAPSAASASPSATGTVSGTFDSPHLGFAELVLRCPTMLHLVVSSLSIRFGAKLSAVPVGSAFDAKAAQAVAATVGATSQKGKKAGAKRAKTPPAACAAYIARMHEVRNVWMHWERINKPTKRNHWVCLDHEVRRSETIREQY